MAVLGTVMAEDVNPYSVISDRNIFHLNPPPPPPAAEAAKPVDLPKVALTGFVGKGSSMRVLLAIPPTKDSKDSAVSYLSLAPGDRDHDVQLVKIHFKEEEVDIINSGTAQTLSRSNNLASLGSPGPRPSGGAPGAPERGIHRPMIPGFAPPPVAPTAATQGGGGASSIVIGGRDRDSGPSFGGSSGSPIVSGGGSRGGGGYTGQAMIGGGQNVNPAASGNVGSQIANSLFNPSTGHYQPAIPTGPIVPPEQQGPIMAAQKLANPTPTPPLPPSVQEELDAAMGNPPPIPGNQ